MGEVGPQREGGAADLFRSMKAICLSCSYEALCLSSAQFSEQLLRGCKWPIKDLCSKSDQMGRGIFSIVCTVVQGQLDVQSISRSRDKNCALEHNLEPLVSNLFQTIAMTRKNNMNENEC